MERQKKYKTEEERKEARRLCLKKYYQTNKEKLLGQMKQWREKNADYNKQYYTENKEKLLGQMKQRYETNKEKIAEYNKEYYEVNKEKFAEHNKNYYETNKEKIAEYNKEYRQVNKEKILKRQKQYRQDNADKIAERNKKYNQTPMGRATKLVDNHNHEDKKYNRGECSLTSLWVRNYIFPFKCIYCGESDWTKLGCDRKDNSLPHTEDNVVPCCSDCNKKRGTKLFEEFVAECNAEERIKEWEEFLKQKDLEGIATT